MKNENKALINTVTYRAIITDVPGIPNSVIYNFGTESREGTRTAEHRRQLKRNNCGVYEIVSEIQDRVFGKKMIDASHDRDYINQLKEELKNAGVKEVKTLHESDLCVPGLSATECLILPTKVYKSALFEKAIKNVDGWYYNDKSLRVDLKYSNASNSAYNQLDASGRKKATQPIVWQFHDTIEQMLSTISIEKQIKKISVQSISLAIQLKWFFPEVEEINVLVVADDKEKNEELYNKLDASKLYNIIDTSSDADIEGYYMSLKDVSLIIGNPPYNNSVHAAILSEIVENNPGAEIVWLVPDNLITGKQPSVLKAKKLLENRLVAWKHVGTQFGAIKIVTPISIYHFSAEENDEHLSWDDVKISLKSETLPHYVDLMKKIENAPKINRINKDDKRKDFKIKNGGGTGQQKLENILNKFSSWNGFIPADTLLLGATGALLYARQGIAFTGKITKGLTDAYVCKFNSEKECKEQADKLNDPRYRLILPLLSPNNRDLLCRPEELPESFDACGFTDEEIEELKNYAGIKNL